MCSTLALCGCFATAVGFYVLPRRLWLVCIGTTDKNSIASKVVSSTGIENCNVHFDHILNSEWLSYQIQDILYGNKKNKKEEWITGDTWKKIDERKETKKKLNQATSQRLKDRLQTAYSEQDKEVKRMTRKDKKEFVDKVADEAENAAERRDLRSLYKITKTLTGGFHNNDRPVKDIND